MGDTQHKGIGSQTTEDQTKTQMPSQGGTTASNQDDLGQKGGQAAQESGTNELTDQEQNREGRQDSSE